MQQQQQQQPQQQPPPPAAQPAPTGGAAPPPPGASPPNNGKAVAALVLGIAGCCLIGILGAVPALILGYMARKEIAASNGAQGGDGMALAGIILGWIGVALTVLFFILFIIYGIAIFAVISGGLEEYCEENPDDEACQDAATGSSGWSDHHPIAVRSTPAATWAAPSLWQGVTYHPWLYAPA